MTTALPFDDARGCKKWLASIAVSNVPQAQQTVLDMVRVLNRSPMPALERLKCLETCREKAGFLQNEARIRLGSKSLPLEKQDDDNWQLAFDLAGEMENGYRQCLNVAEIEGGDLATAIAFMQQRLIRYIALQFSLCNLIYRPAPPGLWIRLHQVYRESEARGVARDFVKDSLEAYEGNSSVQGAYVETLLRQESEPNGLSPQQQEMVDQIVMLVGSKATLVKETAGLKLPPSLAVELTIDNGPLPSANVPPGPATRFIATDALFRNLRGGQKKLTEGELPPALGLPANWNRQETLQLLQRLEKCWCSGGLPRPQRRSSSETMVQLATGFYEAYTFIAGRPFEPPDGTRALTPEEERDIGMFGRISAVTHQRLRTVQNVELDTWLVIDEAPGMLRVQRPDAADRRVAWGRLLVIKLGMSKDFYLATIKELLQDDQAGFRAMLIPFAGKPQPIAINAPDRAKDGKDEWLPGFEIPANERLQTPATLVVPVGYATPGRVLRFHRNAVSTVKVKDVIERGVDFARVSYVGT